MARGSIVWRCQVCGTRMTRGACKHDGGYSVIYPVERWDPEQGRVIKGQKWEKVKGTRREDAETRLAERLKSTHEGTYRELQEATFANFADKWLADYAKGQGKGSTYQSYESHVRVHLKPAFGALSLRGLREETIQGYLSAKLAEGQRPKSVKNHLLILKTMLRHTKQ